MEEDRRKETLVKSVFDDSKPFAIPNSNKSGVGQFLQYYDCLHRVSKKLLPVKVPQKLSMWAKKWNKFSQGLIERDE